MNLYKQPELTEMQYRPCPFWSWNSDLEPEELRSQIRAMHAAGLGGFFMHARGGLKTEYMSARWMECIEACLDEAEKLGMSGWLYDENGWPSGFGGGIVNGMGVDYQQKYLVYERLSAAGAAAKKDAPETVAFYDAATLRKLDDLSGSGDVLRFFYEVNPYYVDNLDGKVVAEFIRAVYEFYYRELPPEMTKRLRGIFTDEPQLSRRGMLWSFVLCSEYQKEYGRELLEELPCIFFDTPEAPAMRTRFWRLVSKLFARNFLKQIGDWCEAHGWQLTGHHVLEETYLFQLTSNGSIMPQYQYYHIPGMDVLTRNEPGVIAMDQLTSAAAQAGQKQILTESFALTGWNFNFRGMKWLYQIQMAHGVNFLCQHLESYSLKGCRKRDYPGSWFTHQPWWGDYKYLNDRFTRTGRYLAEGEITSDILLLHGMTSAWTIFNDRQGSTVTLIDKYNGSLQLIADKLHALHARAHFGDEIIMESDAAVENGRLRVGKCFYTSVVIPQINNMFRSTFELLREFAAAGGKIFAVRNFCEPGRLLIDGEGLSAEEAEFFRTSVKWFDNECNAANAAAELYRNIKITGSDGAPCINLISAVRKFDDFEGLGKGTWYFIVNRHPDQEWKVTITFPCAQSIYEIDADTGKPVAGYEGTVAAVFAPAGSRMYFVPEKASADVPAAVPEKVTVPVARLSGKWQLTAPVENILTLDNARWQIDGGDWVSDHISMIQPELLRKGRECDVVIEYDFNICGNFSKDIYLIVEDPASFEIALNGQPVSNASCGYLFDKAFSRVILPGKMLKEGVNTVAMKTRFYQAPEVYECLEKAKQFETEYNKLSFDSEIEAVYLAGEFRVEHNGFIEENLLRDYCVTDVFSFGKGWGYNIDAIRMNGTFAVTGAGNTLDIANINKDGYPFFAGKLAVQKEFELTAEAAATISRITFNNKAFNSVEVIINGTSCGKVYWEPWEVAVPAGLLRAGNNTIELRLTQSLRNMLGPFHLEQGESGCVSTLHFNKGENVIGWKTDPFTPGYCFTVCGVEDITFEG